MMIFIFEANNISGETAVEIVRRLEARSPAYAGKNRTVRDFLLWSLDRLADRIPARELDVTPDLDDETISFNYLCLLDACGIATLTGQARVSDATRTPLRKI